MPKDRISDHHAFFTHAVPTTAQLHYKAIERLNAAIAQENETVTLRQSFIRVAQQAVIKVQRYRHAKQMKRAKKMMRKLNTY